MLRSLAALDQNAVAETALGSDEAKDILYHCFQDIYHLKDWLKNDPCVLAGKAAEDAVDGSKWLKIAADMCNATKHLKLGGPRKPPPRTGDYEIGIVSQSATVNMTTHGISTSWVIEVLGEEHDAHEIARRAVADWEEWLRSWQRPPLLD